MSERETRKPQMLKYRRRKHVAGALLMLLSLGARLAAASDDEGLLLAAGDGVWHETAALETAVQFRVHGLIARVEVHQRYRNDSADWLEGRYLLPLPEDAAVDRLSLRIGERLIEGEVREKEQARALYAEATANGQHAGLVESERPNLFRTAIGNIGPGEPVDVTIGYWQPVRFVDGEFSVSLPLTLTPRYQPSQCNDCGAPGVIAASAASVALAPALPPTVSVDAAIDAGIALTRVYSPTHRLAVQRKGTDWQARLGDRVEASDRDFELRWVPTPSARPRSAVFTQEVDGMQYALAMLVPPTLPAESVPRELILVIDHSGSMMGASMDQAIAAMDQALSRLHEGDRFNVVAFDDQTDVLYAQPQPALAANIAEARAWVAALSADGGTEIATALEYAFRVPATPGYLRQVVLATDAAVSNESDLLSLIERERGDARLFTVGIGSAPNAWLVNHAATLGGGSAVLVRDTGALAERMDALLSRLERPALRDLALDWPSLAESYPARLPDLYAGEPLQAVVRMPLPGGVAQVSAQSRHGIWQQALDLDHAVHADGVARLWGRARIAELEDGERRGNSEGDPRAQIVATALQFGLVSRYTSLVAVERTPARPRDAALASTQFMNATPAGSLNLAQGATNARALIAVAMLLSLLALALWPVPTRATAHAPRAH